MADGDDPMREVVATGALVLVLGAIIGGVLGVVELGRGSVVTAVIAWAAAVVGLTLSLAHFVADARRSEH